MKIKKFLAMVSLSAFVLTNVIPIGVLAGGENQKRRLKSVAYSSSDFKGYVDNFIVGHRKWFGLLTNKAKMEELELSDVCDWYQSNCRRNHVGEYLAFLYSLVSSHKSWFKSDDVADFASGLCLDYTPGTYDDYLCIVQDLLSDLKRKFGEGDITDKIKGVSISMGYNNFKTEVIKVLVDRVKNERL